MDALRGLGHDVLTTLDTGKAGQKIPDEQVLAFSVADGRILLTLNRKDFIRLDRANPEHAGIIVCTYDADSNALAQRIHAVIAANPDMSRKLERVNRPNPPNK